MTTIWTVLGIVIAANLYVCCSAHFESLDTAVFRLGAARSYPEMSLPDCGRRSTTKPGAIEAGQHAAQGRHLHRRPRKLFPKPGEPSAVMALPRRVDGAEFNCLRRVERLAADRRMRLVLRNCGAGVARFRRSCEVRGCTSFAVRIVLAVERRVAAGRRVVCACAAAMLKDAAAASVAAKAISVRRRARTAP